MNRAELIRFAGRLPVLSHALRFWAGRYPEGSVVTISSGYAKGLRWQRFHRYVNGYWVGQYELEMQTALTNLLKPGDRFFDIGANAGFFSLIGANVVGPKGSCISFDPDPANQISISAQRDLNQFAHWQSVACAISDQSGRLKFTSEGPGSPTARLQTNSQEGPGFEADAMTIDQACAIYGSPDLIKMDIEGAEILALKGATKTLREIRPTLLIELHSEDISRQVRELLSSQTYQFYEINGKLIREENGLPGHVLAKPSIARHNQPKDSSGFG